MYDDIYLVRREMKQPFCFDYLKPFIHECGRVNGNLRAHIPVGMLQRLRSGHRAQCFACASAERSATRSENDFFNRIVPLSCKALEDRAVLAVYRINIHGMCFCEFRDQCTGHHQCFFIGQCDVLACADRTHGRLQSGRTHKGCEDNVDLRALYNLGQGFCACIYLNSGIPKRVFYLGISRLVPDDYCIGFVLQRLLNEQVCLPLCCEHLHHEMIGMCSYYVKGLRAD